MIRYKTTHDIEQLALGGAILADILTQLAERATAGVTGKQLDTWAQELIAARGVQPAFLNYAPPGHTPFPAALCVSVNEAVVHGLPTSTPLTAGDVVSLDLGIVYHGLYLDSAHTVIVPGEPLPEDIAQRRLIVTITREALVHGIAAARVGNTLGDIGVAIQKHVEAQGFSVVRQLVGHGVGYAVHEEPAVPNFGRAGKGLKLQAGLVIAIEPMVTMEDPAVGTADDGWTVVAADGGVAAHEEHTVAITKDGPRILTAAREAHE